MWYINAPKKRPGPVSRKARGSVSVLCITGQCSMMLLACILDGMHGALSPQTSKMKLDVALRACPLGNLQNKRGACTGKIMPVMPMLPVSFVNWLMRIFWGRWGSFA